MKSFAEKSVSVAAFQLTLPRFLSFFSLETLRFLVAEGITDFGIA